MATAGSTYTIFRPRVYIAPLGSVLPGNKTAFGGAWPTSWVRVQNTEEGVMITPTSPKEDIDTDENGTIGIVPEGGDQINISFTSKTPDMDLLAYLSSFKRQAVAAVPETTAGAGDAKPAYERFSLDKEGRPFMIGIEGTYSAGALDANGGFVRAFGYKVEQTEEVELQFRSRGADAVLSPAANVRCLATSLEAAQLTGTGIQEVDSRFDLFKFSNAV